jgi:hypothetical protein
MLYEALLELVPEDSVAAVTLFSRMLVFSLESL